MKGDLCVICGARVTNINPKVNTCDRYCQLAKDINITRIRAFRLIEAGEPWQTLPCRPAIPGNIGAMKPNIIPE